MPVFQQRRKLDTHEDRSHGSRRGRHSPHLSDATIAFIYDEAGRFLLTSAAFKC